MDLVNLNSKNLTYTSCNIYSLICLMIFLPTMIMTILITKLFVSSDINKLNKKCSPISYYFGETNGCNKMINENIYTETFTTNQKDKYVVLMDFLESSSENILTVNEKIKNVFYHYLVKLFKTIYAILQKNLHI